MVEDEKPVLELLNITQKTPLEVTTDGRNLIVSPVSNQNREAKFKKALAKINLRHKKTLKRLAN